MKQSLKQLLLILSLTLYSSAHGMDLQHNITRFVEDGSYAFGTCFVMIAQAIRLHLALFAYQLSPQARELGLQIATNQLKLIEKKLKEDEQNAINDLYTEFKINAETQSLITSWIEQAKELTTTHYQSPAEDAIHDPSFPSDIFPILRDNDINPASIDLRQKPQGEFCASSMIGTIDIIKRKDQDKKTVTCRLCPTITIFTHNYFALSITCQQSLLIHETEHLRSFHPIVQSLLVRTIRDFTDKTSDEIGNSNSYQKLVTIQERQAEIFPAIRNAQNAKILTYSRYCGNYPGHLHLGHLLQLTEITNLHRCIARLKNYNPLPIQKFPDFKTKFNAPKQPSQPPRHQSPRKPKVVRVDLISADAQLQAIE